MADILIVEDDRRINELIRRTLSMTGHAGLTAFTGREALSVLGKSRIDLILLDIGLPDMDGFVLMRRLSEEYGDIPVICVTARDEVPDRIKGLRGGAEDYIVKPFAMEELLARIRVALNRHSTERKENKKELSYGELHLDMAGHTVFYGKEELSLTKKEYDLLECLMRNQDVALSREQLLNQVWDYEYMGDTNVVDVYIRYLRQKIDDRFGIHMIETVRGVGYVIRSMN